MSISVLASVWNHSKAKLAARLVILAIADFADEDGVAWPSVQTISNKARLSERTTQYCIRELMRLGELSVELNCGPHGCNLYRVSIVRPAFHANDRCKRERPPVKSSVETPPQNAPKPSVPVNEPSEEPSFLSADAPPKSRLRGFVGSEDNPKPSESEVAARFMELGMPEPEAKNEAIQFVAHFNSNGWRVGGRTRMVSWRDACTTWIGRWRKDQKQMPLFQVREKPSVILATIQQQIDNHVANKRSARFRPSHTPQERQEFDRLLARKTELTKQIALEARV